MFNLRVTEPMSLACHHLIALSSHHRGTNTGQERSWLAALLLSPVPTVAQTVTEKTKDHKYPPGKTLG